jgi:4-hydroxy-3-polyprenylbenzoate decarboxylase
MALGMPAHPPRRLVVGITGATGILYGIRLLETLRGTDVETHLVVSKAGDLTRAYETALSAEALRGLATASYAPGDIAAPIASGSFRTMGMVVIPCSARTLAEVAAGSGPSLLARAADVVLKERRRLVLVVRETPLSLIHVRNMCAVTEAGGVIMPPVPAFYTLPASVEDLVNDTVARVLDQFGIETPGMKRWGETPADGAAAHAPAARPRTSA